MGAAGDNFCLRWNDFETNISNSFRELRSDNEFFDVTLCCDNGIDRLQAHKVILAACSPLFRRLLSPSNNLGPASRQGAGAFIGTYVNSQPLLYMKGIHQRELEAVLNFMYHGEVNVAQDCLNAFLAVAEELAVKGLTTESKTDETLRNSGSFSKSGKASSGLGGINTEEFSETDQDFNPIRKGHSLKRISFGGEKGATKKSYSLSQIDTESANISGSNVRASLKKRPNEGAAVHASGLSAKRVKSEPGDIQIEETTSLAVTEHSTSIGSGQVDPGEYVDDGSGDPDFEEAYGYNEGDLEDTGGGVSGGEATKESSALGQGGLQTMEDYITRNNMGTYWCKGCGQHACSRKDLTRHIEAKHLNNIYNCKYCDFKINTRYGLQRHLNKQHKQPGMSINEIMKWHMD